MSCVRVFGRHDENIILLLFWILTTISCVSLQAQDAAETNFLWFLPETTEI